MQVRCPQCHRPIELASDGELSDIACPSCGSKFTLAGKKADDTTVAQRPRTIAHFELLEQVGVGAFGSVWKARDTELDRVVALKIPRRSQLDPAETQQFLREARAAAQVRHPNIVSVHEVGRDGDSVFIVSDYVDGANLKDWLTGTRLSHREAAELCVKIAEAAQEPLGLSFVGRGFDVQLAVPFGRDMNDALTDVAEECVAACPTAALQFAKRSFRELIQIGER